MAPRSKTLGDSESAADDLRALADPVAVRRILVRAAKDGRAVSYSEALAALGYRFTRPKMRALCATLAEVDRRCVAKGEPELAVLVVRESDGFPGQGWWMGATAAQAGYDGLWTGPEARRLIDAEQARAFGYWQQPSNLRKR